MSKYSDSIMGDLRESRDLERNDTSQDSEIEKMSEDEVLEEVLNWNGIIGYASNIKLWVENIYNIDLINKY